MPITRRAILRNSSLRFGMIGLNSLLATENPLAPKQPHLIQRAKRVIVLFMDGGPSHIDSFDRKPRLEKDHLKPPPFKLGMVFNKDFGLGNLMKSPYEFKRYGQMGMEVSDLFPNVAQHVDKMCFVRSMVADGLDHGGALLQMHTGTLTLHPSVVRLLDALWLGHRESGSTGNPDGSHAIDGPHYPPKVDWASGPWPLTSITTT